MTDKTGARSCVGGVEMDCPSGCGTRLRTSEAASETQLPGGLRWTGVPCPTCGTSYTIEMVKTDTHQTQEATS